MINRRGLNKLISPLGYEIVKKGKFSWLLEREYLRSSDFKFIQIGANDGVSFDNLYEFVTTRKCSGVVVEPLSYYFKILVENYSKCPNIIPVQNVINDSDEVATIYYVDPLKSNQLPDWTRGIGSLNKDHHKNLGEVPTDHIISENVPSISFMELVEKFNMHHASLLQIDTEGFDGQIIKMIDFDSFRANLIKFESEHLSKEEDQEVSILLKKNGYKLYKDGLDTIAVCKLGLN